MNIIVSSQLTIVAGLGVSGLSVARYLQKKNKRFAVVDSRENPPNVDVFKNSFPDVPLITGSLDVELLSSAEEIILSPGISLKTPEIQQAITAGVKVIGDIELFAREVDAPVIAITGSNAKTTVTTLVGELAKACGINVAIGGNIGCPVLDLLEDGADCYVLELSSFQLETTHSLKPAVATILNITEDHMDRYANLMEYFRAKQRIYFGAKTIVFNRDDKLTQPPMADNVNYLSFGSGRSDRNQFGFINGSLSFEFKGLFDASQLAIKGKHNHLNALAALAIGHAAGFDRQKMVDALLTFRGLPHRCQLVAKINGVEYINDSKATNVGATLAALEGFGEADNKTIILIAGGEGKGADFTPLQSAIKRYVKQVILIGADATVLAKAIDRASPIKKVNTLKEAIVESKSKAVSGDVVLLSPACASFDMFNNFEARGDAFIEVVMELAA